MFKEPMEGAMMAGMETLTMLVSSAAMSVPIITIPITHQR